MNTNSSKNWHHDSIDNIFEYLGTSIRGLSKSEVAERLSLYGKNSLPEAKPPGFLFLFIKQFKSPLIYVLILAGLAMLLLSDVTDALIIFFVLFLNSLLGLFQENKANRTLNKLKQFSKGVAVAIRDGVETEIDDALLVIGDVVVLRVGDKVPADARILKTDSLKVNESALTGESEPVEKDTNIYSEETPLPERRNMLYKSTLVVSGEATAIVVATGINTFVGSIAEKLKDIDSEMPLKSRIDKLSRQIGFAVFVSILVIVAIGFLRGFDLRDIFFTFVAVAVSLIPEGLPIIITLILARGVYRMAKRNALIKNMQAVEALGQADIIAVDKTGTITKNELMVERVFVGGREFKVFGSGFEPKGSITFEENIINPANHQELLFSGRVASYCASAKVEYKDGGVPTVIGDPTEAALLVLGQKVGFNKDELESEDRQVFSMPFSFEHKFHTTMHKNGNKFFLSVVGAPESVLAHASKYWTLDSELELSEENIKTIEQKIEEYSSMGLRVICFAFRESAEASFDLENIPKITFGGLFAMADVLREEINSSVSEAIESGVKVVMITGDHFGTARAIAKQAGIFRDGDQVLTGQEISSLSIEELSLKLDDRVSVFARVLPEHKLSIVEAYKLRGKIVGMTGDGVNDALSLQSAHLGISMGRGGTEVAKEASDIVLVDNNFRSIIAAIEEGRSIYVTIKKVILYLISTSMGEFLSIAVAISLGFPIPLSPSQILWLNVVTDGFFVIALSFEPNISIRDKFNKIGEGLVGKADILRAFILGFVMMLGTMVLLYFGYNAGYYKVWTMILTLLVVFQWFNAWNCRSDKHSVFYNTFSNKYLLLGLLGAVSLHSFALYHPFMNKILKVVPLDITDWMIVVMLALSIVLVEEFRKYIKGRQIQYLQKTT